MTTLAGLAQSSPEVSILVDVLAFLDANIPGSALLATLSDPDTDLTVFAPTNAAFGQLATDLGYSGDPAGTAAVTAFLAGSVEIASLNQVVL